MSYNPHLVRTISKIIAEVVEEKGTETSIRGSEIRKRLQEHGEFISAQELIRVIEYLEWRECLAWLEAPSREEENEIKISDVQLECLQ